MFSPKVRCHAHPAVARIILPQHCQKFVPGTNGTVLIDGFTFKMPDTPKNQAVYPQHTAQKPGLGFPIARVVALLHLGTGCLVDVAIEPYQGKDISEIAMLRHLFRGGAGGSLAKTAHLSVPGT